MKKLLIGLIYLQLLSSCSVSKNEIIELTNDGTWCWFSDPRALFNAENNLLITGYVTEDGSVAALQNNLSTGKTTIATLNDKLEVDDHNNPAFVQRVDGRFLAFYTKHHNSDLYMNVSIHPNDATEWSTALAINPNGADDVEKYGDDKYTYANPFILKNEKNRIYLFGRWIGFKPNISWSDDGGESWSEGRVVVCPEPFSWGQRPYVKYYSDGLDKIHMVFTDGHPRDEPTNSVYYACYYEGAFHKANGAVICTLEELPFEPKEATLVYDAKTTGHRAWVYDVYADEMGNPAIAYARYPTETDHIYHYAQFNGQSWKDTEMVNSGQWFPQTPEGKQEREPHYSGGLTLSANEKNTVYISIEKNGVFEIEQWKLKEEGWKITPITTESRRDQVRPYAVKNRKGEEVLLWNSVDRYIHYTDYRTTLKMYRK